ncbi:molybdopterin-dependent oxidoreductase [Sphaerimonospora cavernae]|uniref:Molybdopterin-dependent oxidoreductase n=1 Tax=Sphaerimonospora cavernae TaxID=1740611 RepID=A0ABV6U4A7_9ACTN
MLDRIAAPNGLRSGLRSGSRSGSRTPYGPPGSVERLAAALPGRLRDALPTEIRSGSPWPVRVDVLLDDGITEDDVESWVPAVSMLHSGGDALELAVRGGRVVGVRGQAADRVNHGRLDPQEWPGRQGRQGRRHAGQDGGGRLTRPLVREHGRLVETTWDVAMDRVAARSRELLARPGGWGRVGFHTGGRLFLEEYYTLAVIGRAGIGTPHMDCDTRLSTAAASAALMESFGTDGPPGSYGDLDHCDAIAMWGCDPSCVQPVLWERVLDRRLGPGPPALIVVGPEGTPAAREADVHLAVRRGTNVALMNALLHELIANGWYDEAYVANHTAGFDELCRAVDAYPAKRAAEICGVPVTLVEQAAEILGAAERLVSVVAGGFHLAWQATAATCQVNNVHLLRGMLGRPGAGVLHAGGPPSARGALETGAAGGLPGLRNWANPRHARELAALWNVDLPRWGPATHAMRIFRYAEEGSIGLLWISGADPVRSLPGAGPILRRKDLFVVVQDLFLTETARLADVVLPAAGWGEKLGTVTGADRTVHICGKAVEPPGEARPDLDVFLDYARRMDFRDRDGAPLIGWHDPRSAFEAWQACSRGRPCDYTGITYERLRRGGIQWPCTPSSSHGTERLYAGGRFNTDPDACQTYGHDLVTGAEYGEEPYRRAQSGEEPYRRAQSGEEPYRRAQPGGERGSGSYRAPGRQARAFLRAAEYEHPQHAATMPLDGAAPSPDGHLDGRVNGGTHLNVLNGGADGAVDGAPVVTGWDAVARQPLLAPAPPVAPVAVDVGGVYSAASPLDPLIQSGVAATTGGGPVSERLEEV